MALELTDPDLAVFRKALDLLLDMRAAVFVKRNRDVMLPVCGGYIEPLSKSLLYPFRINRLSNSPINLDE